MKTSIIISTYSKDRLGDVLKCLGSLEAQSLKPDEVILVLDPIPDLISFYKSNLAEIFPDLIIESSEDFGLSNARNKGIENSTGEIIAFIDDDAWADEKWLENLVRNFKNESVCVAGGKIIPVFDDKRPKWLPEELDWIVGCTYKGMPEERAEVRNPIGANMAFRREVFEVAGKFRTEVGRYGKRLLGSEETELCMRLKMIKPEVRIIYDPSAIVYHRVPESRAKISYALKRAYYEGYSKVILSREYDLATEKEYLKFLFKAFLKKVFSGGNQVGALGILLIVVSVFVGNVQGHLQVNLLSKK